jgi:hypothetical protein
MKKGNKLPKFLKTTKFVDSNRIINKLRYTICMKKIGNYIFLLIFIFSWGLALNSCDTEPAEYISIYIINHTIETVLVYGGASVLFVSLPSASIPAGGERAVLVKKGESVIVYGKDSNKLYGARAFNFETDWEIR